MKTFGTKFWKLYRKASFYPKWNRKNFSKMFNVMWLQIAITAQWLQIVGNSLPNDPHTGFLVSISTVGINSNSFRWAVHSVQETSPYFLWRTTLVDNTADNANITQSQAANHHRLLSHMTTILCALWVVPICRRSNSWRSHSWFSLI